MSLLEAFGSPRPLDRQGPNSEKKTKLILKTLQEDVHRFEVAPFKILSCFWWVHSFPRFCKFDITQFDGNYSSLVFEDKTYPLSRGCLFLLQYRRWNARPLLDQRKRSGSKRLYAGRQLAHSGCGRQWCFQKIKIISVCCLFSVHAHRFSVAQSCTRESRAVKGLGSDSGCNMWRRPWPVEAQSGTGHQPTYNKGRLGPGLGCNIGSMLVWNACSTLAIWGMRPGLPSWPPEPIKIYWNIFLH